ncbi:MAG: M36 family metallopeptidase [Planctomycetes bacterium]|nr:M36 family metallopeptidase [Planctomycetota bacterium]
MALRLVAFSLASGALAVLLELALHGGGAPAPGPKAAPAAARPAVRPAAPPLAPAVAGAAPGAPQAAGAAARVPGAPLFAMKAKAHARHSRTVRLNDPPEPGCRPAEAALRALERHEAELGPAGWVRELALRDVRRTPSASIVRFQQESKGMPVLGGGAIVAVGPSGGVTYASVRVLPGLPEGASTVPVASADEARASAAAEFDVEDGVESREPDLFVVQDEPEGTLAWVVPVTTAVPFGSFLVDVDAGTADVIRSRDVLKTATGRGRVFRPNPVASTGDTSLRDRFDRSSAVLEGAEVDVDLEELDGSGLLRGPLADVSAGDGTERVTRGDLQFNFTRSEPGFEQTMVYYYLHLALAYAGTIGRPNPLERTLIAEARFARGGEEELNAFFDPATGKVHFGTQGVDLAEDATVILHELGHALQDAAASTPALPFGATHEGGSMGEGFGDYWAVSVLSEFIAHEPRFIGHWVTYGDLDLPFGDAFFKATHRRVDSDKVWPRDADPGRDIHLDGEIWSAALFEIRNILGRDDANRLVLDSHYRLQPDAGFQEGSQALLDANQSLFGGAREEELKAILMRRGLFDPEGTSAGDDELEDNDTPLEATYVLIEGDGVRADGLVCRDDDWYWIPVEVGKVLHLGIRFVHQNGDLDLGLAVLDPASLQLLAVAESATEGDIEEILADTGGLLQALADDDGIVHFFALVRPFQGAANDYDFAVLLIDSSQEESVVELAVGDSLEAAAGQDDVDIAQFEAIEAMTLSVQTKKKGKLGAVVEAELRNDDGVVFGFGAGLGSRGTKTKVTLPSTGVYTLLLRGANGSTGDYSLKLKGKAPKLKLKETLSFASDQELAFTDFDALAGSLLVLKAKPKGKNPDGSKLEPVVSIFDGGGNLLGTSGDPGGQKNAVLILAAPVTGTYFAVVSPGSGSSGSGTVTGSVKLPKSKRVLREALE